MVHWDRAIRQLTAQSLNVLTPLNPKHIHDFILPKLIANCSNSDLIVRHGSLLGVAGILRAFSELKKSNKNFEIEAQRQQELLTIIPTIEKERLYRGKGGELIRLAVCSLIESISIAKIPLVLPTPPPTSTTTTKVRIFFNINTFQNSHAKHI